jgi:hypothetical protein
MAKQGYPTVERHANGVTVIARSNVEAQEAASVALGTDCTITSVEKVREGGIGGFFATELVKITAKPSRLKDLDDEFDVVFASAEDLVSSLRSKAPDFADRLLDEWRQESGLTPERPAAQLPARDPEPTHLRPPTPPTAQWTLDQRPYQLTPPSLVDVAPPIHQHAPATQRPAAFANPAPAPARRLVDQRWSHRALRAMGVPDRVVDMAMTVQPVTEGDWTVALMGALRHYCGRDISNPMVMVGSSCANLARQLRLVSVTPEDLIESVSSVAVPNITARAAASGLNGRLVHLVVGGSWQHLGGLEVQLVSAGSSADLLEALRVCVGWDAGLGWYWSGDRYDRLDEFAVVSHIRAMLGVAEPVFVAQ